MSFTDNLKKSLGFEEENSNLNIKKSLGFEEASINTSNLRKGLGFGESYENNYEGSDYGLDIDSEFDEEYLEDFTISPEQPYYDIVLIKPTTMDEMDYVFDQIVEEANPVVLDLIFLKKKGVEEYRQAGEKLKILREQYNAHAISISNTSDKNLILIAPSRVRIVNKD